MEVCRWMQRWIGYLGRSRSMGLWPMSNSCARRVCYDFTMPISESDFQKWKAAQHGDAVKKTISGLPLEPLYVSQPATPLEEVPGQPPFTRGIHSGMYRQKLWTFRQYSGFGSAAETNARWKQLLKNGVSGLSTAFDLPTQLGLDPDDSRARGEVGRVGVPVASVEDMHRL